MSPHEPPIRQRPPGRRADLIGESLACQRVRQLIERMALTDRPLLIRGPTGAGKEVVGAVYTGWASSQKLRLWTSTARRFRKTWWNPAIWPCPWAFTGASNYRAGFSSRWGRARCFWMKSANCRWRCNPSCCACWKPVSSDPVQGSTDALPFHGRIVAATHRDLAQMVRDGQFREDLYYRLAVFCGGAAWPGPAQRNIPALVRHFAGQQSRALSFTPKPCNGCIARTGGQCAPVAQS